MCNVMDVKTAIGRVHVDESGNRGGKARLWSEHTTPNTVWPAAEAFETYCDVHPLAWYPAADCNVCLPDWDHASLAASSLKPLVGYDGSPSAIQGSFFPPVASDNSLLYQAFPWQEGAYLWICAAKRHTSTIQQDINSIAWMRPADDGGVERNTVRSFLRWCCNHVCRREDCDTVLEKILR